MKLFFASCLVAAATAAPWGVIFQAGDAPKCHVNSAGATVVQYDAKFHDSFKCTHSGNVCSCTAKHDSHHHGKCKQFDHTDGTTLKFDGDCTDSGRNPVHGGWSAYTPFTTCTKSCGGGSQKRTRTCTNPAPKWNGRPCSGSPTHARACNTHACPTNCVTSGWKAWSACTKSCGGGSQVRSRSQTEPTFGGKACPHYTETRACNSHGCPVNCLTGTWSLWTSCTKSCGNGSQRRSRHTVQPTNGGMACPHGAETRACGKGPCPIHCATSAFGAWTPCTKSCASGSQSRSRSIKTHARHGGYVCPYLAETRNCNTHNCPKNCVTSGWKAWSACTKSCGGGSQQRNRNQVEPKFGGKGCPHYSETRSCKTQSCPVNGGYSGWSGYGGCSKNCGGGSQTRTRSCTNPKPQHGGANCAGASSQSRSCNTHHCPINGGWSGWSGYGGCNRNCGGGSQTRTRSCNNPRPQHGGSNCGGSSSQSRSCNTHSCRRTINNPSYRGYYFHSTTSGSHACRKLGYGSGRTRANGRRGVCRIWYTNNLRNMGCGNSEPYLRQIECW